jgi:hypothetical protein
VLNLCTRIALPAPLNLYTVLLCSPQRTRLLSCGQGTDILYTGTSRLKNCWSQGRKGGLVYADIQTEHALKSYEVTNTDVFFIFVA